MRGTYKSSKEVLAPPSSGNSIPNTVVNKGQVKPAGLCPKKNYFVTSNENYVFLSGTVRPPFEREFNMDGVT
jgi:hypothetical protein